jgi:hypothetical protein
LVIRINGKIDHVIGIHDHYTIVILSIPKKDLNEEAIKKLTESYHTEDDNYIHLYENEAKDQVRDIGNLKINIETINLLDVIRKNNEL